MEAIYNSILSMVEHAPVWLQAAAGGLLLSWLVVQSVKFMFPITWPSELRKEGAWLIAFGTAFLTVIYIMGFPAGAFIGLLCGFGSPIAFALLMNFLRWKWPSVADVLSGDTRGVWFGEKRENKE